MPTVKLKLFPVHPLAFGLCSHTASIALDPLIFSGVLAAPGAFYFHQFSSKPEYLLLDTVDNSLSLSPT
jgi:hypothetical protein